MNKALHKLGLNGPIGRLHYFTIVLLYPIITLLLVFSFLLIDPRLSALAFALCVAVFLGATYHRIQDAHLPNIFILVATLFPPAILYLILIPTHHKQNNAT